MNINECIDIIKKMAGLNGVLKGIYPDNLIKDSILNNSLKTFNMYSWFTLKFTSDTLMQQWERKNTDSNNGLDIEVILPPQFEQHFIELGTEIVSVQLDKRSIYPMAGLALSRGMQDDLPLIFGNQVARSNWDNPKVSFRAPRTIILKDWGYSAYQIPLSYSIFFRCTHPRNLSTITKGIERYFVDLCYYDLMINLWNNDFRIMHVQTGTAEVDLNMDNYSSAESNRQELLQTIKKKCANDNIIIEA